MGFFMNFVRDERVILIGMAAAAVGVVSMIRTLATFYRDEAEIHTPLPKPQYITQETEDALKLSTLETLLGHYNFSIREMAARIIWDRAVNDESTLDHLLYGITRPDYDERLLSARALALMLTGRHDVSILHTSKACAALVRCLELCVDPEQEKLDDRYFDECGLRDMTELLCLLFVLQLLMAYGPERILRAKFVEKWLARQNWGDTVEERQRNFADYMQYKQNRVTEIVARIKETRLGRRTLEKAGLIKRKHRGKHVKKSAAAGAHGSGTSNGGGSGGSSSNDRNVVEEPLQLSMDLLPGGNGNGGGEGDGDENGLPDDEIANNETDADEPLSLLPHQQTNEHVPRVLEQSVEEQRLRRLHREAMVLNDGTRPIGRDSIIESHREDFN